MKKMKKVRPFPIREYEALGILAESDATAAEIQAEAKLPEGGRHAARALERLRAFGHVRRQVVPREGVGRREYQYGITKKGAKRLEWMEEHKPVTHDKPTS